MEDRREAGYVITNGNPTGTERKTESKTENKIENKMGNVNGSGIVMGNTGRSGSFRYKIPLR